MSRGGKKQVSPKVIALQELLRRKRGVRDLQKRFLIVCEDGKSAPGYFKSLKRHENLSAASIAVVGSDGNTQPIQVVQEAIRRKKAAASRSSGTVPFDQVWCTIDGDYGDAIANARTSARAHGVRIAVSTMCFEYWILLHFAEHSAPAVNCDAVVHELRQRHLPHYTKGRCDFSAIVPYARAASARAARLRRLSELPEKQNPCSDVYLLIDAILAAIPSDAAMPQGRALHHDGTGA